MKLKIDTTSDAKQYIEKDNLILVENDEITKFDVYCDKEYFRFNSLFETISNLLGLKFREKCIYYTLLYSDKEFRSFRQLCIECSKLFGGNERNYNYFFEGMIQKGIIGTEYDRTVYIKKEYDLRNINTEYLILKLN